MIDRPTGEPRILQVVTDTDRRGAQVFAVDLHHALVDLDVEVETVALAPGTDAKLDLPTLGPTRRHPRTFTTLRQRARDADVVIAHGSTTLPVSAIALAGTGTPLVYRQISDSLFWADDPRRRLQTTAGLSRAARVVALWSGAAEVLTSHFRVRSTKIDVIPNGVPEQRFSPATSGQRDAARADLGLHPDRATVAYVGALAHEKGVDRAIRAVTGTDAQLLIAGAGPDEGRLRRLATDLDARVVFAGSLTEPLPAYHAADLITLPSRGGDSMPAVLIEAGLCGLPAVTTDVAAIPEIVLHGETGIVVAHEDDNVSITALQRALREGLPEGAGEAAKDHCASRYSIAVVAAQWLATARKVTT